MQNIFHWLDLHNDTKKGKLANQLLPVGICAVLFVFFIASTHYFIEVIINPDLEERISLEFNLIDVLVGFFLYFITAIDYALVVGRMQVSNPGSKARVVMNISTVLGAFVGVSIVLFLWGYAKEITWLIIPILIFAGSVMIKLAHEGVDYFRGTDSIPNFLAKPTLIFVEILNYITRVFTFWMPEIAKPSVKAMNLTKLAKWSFILPFIIGLDDLIGYMGAMTIYNAFGLLIGIYFADVLIDVIIFVSPSFTKKLVESSLLSFVATFAFIYLAYKSYSESLLLIHEKYLVSGTSIVLDIALFLAVVIVSDIVVARLQNRKAYITHIGRS